MSSSGLELLEHKIDTLIERCESLAVDNRALRAKQQSLTEDRAKLIEKNELAKTRVESMINRLKALEKTS
ncbi:MAG: TIGR02449 family protein [Gammaproteobacteria bacterium]|nr:TIGR02449 family protein [Gammaproteobacteria bacterium]